MVKENILKVLLQWKLFTLLKKILPSAMNLFFEALYKKNIVSIDFLKRNQ